MIYPIRPRCRWISNVAIVRRGVVINDICEQDWKST